ncbi:beta-lactamase class A [Nocardioides luteus]|uniref:Serine hydrolase n=1 Tax=Nocardioides luteus TaxID=1844 RepID=A0ABQ5T048_9ACTN|nr:serine hydrolase [Nocardioides luteus]MDR7312820.1 beta-lactamase class A [Nocardioides luteus]GGR47789.1 serine hydrolase [Nocardioides luteus]GLJ69074.1 serine hydrolase [Nocardioides luteus]
MSPLIGSDRGLIDLAERITERFRDLQVRVAFLARDIDTGLEVGVGVDRQMPLASVAKVPLALVVADRIARGEIDGGAMVSLSAAERSFGPYGISAFTHDATCSVVDLMLMMLGLSDNAAADALFDLVPPREVDEQLAEWGLDGLRVRHRMQPMYDYATRVAGHDFALATQLAVEGRRPGGRHVIDSLDVERATVGSPRACVSLLERVWRDEIAKPEATELARRLMGKQVFTHRIAADLLADDIQLAGKTGSFLTLRHEIAVVTHAGGRVAIAALTDSDRTARIQNDVDLAIAATARDAVDALASRRP